MNFQWPCGGVFSDEKQEPGTVPLYMYYNGRRCDHYVTIVWQGNKKGDYVYEGNAGYVYP